MSAGESQYMGLVAYAKHIGVPYGTAKRWRGDGLPIAYDFGEGEVRVDVAIADAWVYQHKRQSISFHRTSQVYFVQRVSGPIKIGYSSDIARRLPEIRREIGEPVRLIAVATGDRANEIQLHQAFAKFALGDEWFAPAQEIFEVIHKARGRHAA